MGLRLEYLIFFWCTIYYSINLLFIILLYYSILNLLHHL